MAEDKGRAVRDRVAQRIVREYEQRGTPVSSREAYDRATRIAEISHNEKRDGKPNYAKPLNAQQPLPPGLMERLRSPKG